MPPTTDPTREALIELILRNRPRPEQGFRAAIGILRLATTHGRARLEAACRKALAIGAHSYSSVASILRNNLERREPARAPAAPAIRHPNIPGCAILRSQGDIMLQHPTLDQLRQLKLHGMARAFMELEHNPQADALDHAQWLALLLDREQAERGDRRLTYRLRNARLRHADACVEDVDYRTPRKLDKALFQQLAQQANGSPASRT